MMREGADGEREPFRFAMHSQPKGGHPAFVLKSGERLANPEDRTDLGFQFLVLHECSFCDTSPTKFGDSRQCYARISWITATGCGVRGGQGVTMLVTDT